ncbi:hypothetical protein R1A27_34625 (plasmid) [Methylobacterium sp. NMS12]|uniref:hypothetical protein n=1 Tax=Methylobacterium sp. NMS12 TaxID=3079766 RepID=UPI003F8831F3
MTPKLTERLARLEAAHTAAAPVPMPPELIEANLYAVAIALGGYPRAPEPAPSYRQDNISDGFARGLGYIDRNDMETRSLSDPPDWQARIEEPARPWSKSTFRTHRLGGSAEIPCSR